MNPFRFDGLEAKLELCGQGLEKLDSTIKAMGCYSSVRSWLAGQTDGGGGARKTLQRYYGWRPYLQNETGLSISRRLVPEQCCRGGKVHFLSLSPLCWYGRTCTSSIPALFSDFRILNEFSRCGR
eukprot:COSAG02_NODE_798_length_17086_cov_72.770295_1_plen_125_part_00